MALTTYAQLIDEVQSWLSRSTTDLSDDQVKTFVSMAEDRIAREVRIREMEASADLTVATQEVALPTGFLAVRRLYIDGNPIKRLGFLSPDSFWIRFLSTDAGLPKAFTIEGDNLVFGPSPDSSRVGKLLYYKRLTAFSADSDTNDILTRHRGIYLYASIIEAALYLEDMVSAQAYSVLFDDLVEKVKEMDKRDRFPPGMLEVQPDGVEID